jgi:electron transfer flavoprotein alpha subunit
LAINKNKRHPIFKGSDIGIVGEWETLIPVLFEKLQPIIKNLSTIS